MALVYKYFDLEAVSLQFGDIQTADVRLNSKNGGHNDRFKRSYAWIWGAAGWSRSGKSATGNGNSRCPLAKDIVPIENPIFR